jgi:signal transduction histidine kinase
VKETLERLTGRYAAALKSYLEGQGEESLLRAYETGRDAVAAQLGVLEMSAVHQVALVQVLLERIPGEERQRLARLAADFSAESLVPFELTARGTHEANAMLTQLNETLEGKNAEIRRQLEELTSLQSLKDDLMSLIVHDLRNPLMGVLACLDLLKPAGGDKADETREIVKLALEGTRKLTELIDDILEVRQLETGSLALARDPVSLFEVAREAIATLEAAAKLAEVRLELAVTGEVAPHGLDRKLVRRAVENLLSNALRFAPPRSAIAVTVAAVGAGVTIDVADRGPGVAEDVKDHLFQKFGSVAARSQGARRGHGLGLYFVRLVATAHGGSVSARAREGGGSVFSLVFPARG